MLNKGKSRLTPESFQYFTSLSNIKLNRDGKLCALTVTKPDLEKNVYRSRIHIINTDNGTLVFSSNDGMESNPAWINESALVYISYIGRNEDKSKPIARFIYWRYPSTVKFLIDVDKPVIDYRISRDDSLIALVRDPVTEQDPDYVYSEKIPIWFDSIGFIAGYSNRLYLIDHKSGITDPLTGSDLNITAFDYDPYSNILTVAVNDDPEKPYLSKLGVIDIESGRIEYLLDGDKFYIENLSLKGNLLAVKAHRMERGFASHLKLLLIDLDSQEVLKYEAPRERGLARRVYHDLRGPNSSLPRLEIRNRRIYYLLSDGGRFTLYLYDIDNDKHIPVIDGDFVIDEFDVSSDESIVAYIKTDPVTPAELYIYREGSETQVTFFNKFLKYKYNFIKPKRIIYKASDGKTIEGWIIIPNINSEDKIPAILNIHGGPKSKFGYSFMFEHQLFVDNGYAVIYINPRGSDGYSEEFADIRGSYGTRDYQDLIEGVEHVLKEFKQIDSSRLGVTGISYGGFMVNWIITHTDLFKAAISQNGISSWEAEFGTSDIGFYFVPDQIKGSITRDSNKLVEKSPIYYAENVSTPVLFIHSMNDYRCYIDQSLSFHTVLRSVGKKSAIALFKEGSHTFGWIGKPSSRLKRYRLMLDWFNRFLKGKNLQTDVD